MNFKNEHLTRHLDILPPEKLGVPISIVGAGAIGSWTTLALAKMGFADITVYDMDTIEIENMNCQFYRFADIGKNKAEALHDLVKDFTNVEIEVVPEAYKGGLLKGIVISAVDSMEVRKLIWDSHKNKAHNTKCIIDPRMGAEIAMLFTMDPMDGQDQASYEKSLYTNENAEQERCTAKSTIYTANMLSGLVAKTVKDLVTDGPYPRTAIWSIAENDFRAWSK